MPPRPLDDCPLPEFACLDDLADFLVSVALDIHGPGEPAAMAALEFVIGKPGLSEGPGILGN